jgi:hypothetical protein
VIHTEGKSEASRCPGDAGDVISLNPAALQLRYLQTFVEIASGKNSTTIFLILSERDEAEAQPTP